MISLWVKTKSNGNQWFVIDETIDGIRRFIEDIVQKNKNKKIQYLVENATDEDINKYGGIQEMDVVEYVIEECCLLDIEDKIPEVEEFER